MHFSTAVKREKSYTERSIDKLIVLLTKGRRHQGGIVNG